jgi:transmembrane sensor
MSITDELLERALRGEATREEIAAVAAWRRSSPANEHHYQSLARIIETARALASERAAPIPSATTILARTADRSTSRSRATTRLPWAIAAGAILVAGLSIWQTRGATDTVAPTEVVTGSSELATVHLRDGSVVRLAPSSRLRIHDASLQRHLTLDGRAYFAVARRPGHQFIVRTRQGVARALGTRFELASDAATMRLRVVDGRVALDAPRNRVEVGAGEESAVRDSIASPTAPRDSITWVGNFLGFQATPLADAAREIERVYHARVIVDDSALRHETITATFTDRPLDDVVRVVCSVLAAKCTLHDGQVRIARRPSS